MDQGAMKVSQKSDENGEENKGNFIMTLSQT